VTDQPGKQPAAAERIVIRDKRKISPAGPAQAAPPGGDGASMATPEDPATTAERATDETTDPAAQAATDEAVPGDGGGDQPATAGLTDEAVAAIEGEVVEDTEAGLDVEDVETAEAPVASEPTDEDGSGPLGAELEMLRKQLDEAQVDIKRVAAEYKNYRDRVKRDQAAAAEVAVASVLVALLPVLDDLDRARDHGDLTGPFGSVAEQLLTVVGKLGLTAFGAKGDPFDPKRHEAVAHVPSPDVTEETCIDVMRRGYMLGERLLRPAMVAVAAPQE
jgi:molecular chaperone GrpE